MIDLFLKILAQVTGFLSTVVFPLATVGAGVWLKLKQKVERNPSEGMAQLNPPTEIPAWLKEAEEVKANVVPLNQRTIDEFLHIDTAKVLQASTAQPQIQRKEREEKAKDLEELIEKLITEGKLRLNVQLRLRKEDKVKVLGKDWLIENVTLEPVEEGESEEETVTESAVEGGEEENWEIET